MLPHRGLLLRDLGPSSSTPISCASSRGALTTKRPLLSGVRLKRRPSSKVYRRSLPDLPRYDVVSCDTHSLLADNYSILAGRTSFNDALSPGSRHQLKGNLTTSASGREGNETFFHCRGTRTGQCQDDTMKSRAPQIQLVTSPPEARPSQAQDPRETTRVRIEKESLISQGWCSNQAIARRLAQISSPDFSRYTQNSIANRGASKQAASNMRGALSTIPDYCRSPARQIDRMSSSMNGRAQGRPQVSQETIVRSTPVPSGSEGTFGRHAGSLESSVLNFRPSQKLAYPDLSRSSFVIDEENKTIARISANNADVAQDGDESPGEDVKDQAAFLASEESGEDHSVTPLGFCIPDHLMRSAREALNGSEESYWQHSLYRGPGGNQHTTKVHYCKNKEAMEAVSQLFARDNILGFDIEWMASAKSQDGIRRNVALIQLASEERIGLFHLARFPACAVAEDYVAPTFKAIMESANITKVGVAIKGDSTRLRNFLGVHCRGLFELSHLYRVVRFYSGQPVKLNKCLVSLASQVEEHLGLPLLKTGLQTSDWSRNLDYKQSNYAASDSYAGFQLYHTLEAKRLAIKPTPPRPVHAELNESFGLPEQEEAAISDNASSVSDDSFKSFEEPEDTANAVDDINVDLSRLALTGSSTGPPGLEVEPQSLSPSGPSEPMEASSSKGVSASSKQYDMAQDWATSYKASSSGKDSIALAALRAYHVWYHQELDVPEVAMTLRDPPLKFSTVIDYLCEAIEQTSLPANQKRLAILSTYGIRPYKKSHQRLLRSAVAEQEQKRRE